ncbi:hypothetical protein SMD22_18475 [Brevibacillus halotolerans]|nr:hypothetical protein SMD22_18475 [Brevibacillus halotolerans]
MQNQTGLNPELLESITRAAVQAVIDFQVKEKKKQEKAKKDWRLRNTKLLLKNYRSFVAHSLEIHEEMDAFKKAKALEELYSEDFAVESIKRSKQRTYAMVKFMERMLDVYRTMCEDSEQPEDMRRYQVICEMYIWGKKSTAEQVAKCHKIEVRTVYRDINEAAKTLSVLIFGVDGIRLDG